MLACDGCQKVVPVCRRCEARGWTHTYRCVGLDNLPVWGSACGFVHERPASPPATVAAALQQSKAEVVDLCS